jgi:hypothetical protein
MKSELNKRTNQLRLKTDDFRTTDESSDWIIVRLHSKVKAAEVKYSDLLARIHKFIADIKTYLGAMIPNLAEKEYERLSKDISYFLSVQDTLYSSQLFSNFKNEVLDKVFSDDFNKENFKNYFSGMVNELAQGVGAKEPSHERKKSQASFEGLDYTLNGSCKKDLNPVRTDKRSISPNDKHNYNKEINELKKTILDLNKEKEYLKAWKENMLKNPNFELTAQRVIKDLRDENELISMRNSYLKSKLAYIVNSVSKFLNISSRFQKPLREKEGYLSVNIYENEKHRLELKLREVLETNKNFYSSPSLYPQSPVRTIESDTKSSNKNFDSLNESKKKIKQNTSIHLEKNSKHVEEIKHQQEIIENYKKTISKLENDNKSLRSKCLAASKEIKNLNNEKESFKLKIREKQSKSIESTENSKVVIEKLFLAFGSSIKSKLEEITRKLDKQNYKISNLKSKFSEGLKRNLNSLIAINEKVESNDLKLIERYKAQIENLEYVILKNKNYSDNKIQELEEIISDYENNKKDTFHLQKSLEDEISKLAKDNSHTKRLENTVFNQKILIETLEDAKEAQIQNLQELKKTEIIAEQYKFERDLLENENIRISEELVLANKTIIEMQQVLQSQALDANKKIDQIVLEKNELEERLKKINEDNSNTNQTTPESEKTKRSQEKNCEISYNEPISIPIHPANLSGQEQFAIIDLIATKKELEAEKISKKLLQDELKCYKKYLLISENEKDILRLELIKVRENYRNFEYILKSNTCEPRFSV